MKEKIKKIIHLPWFKLFIVLAILFFLVLQYGNFEIERRKALFNVCKESNKKDTIEFCITIFSKREIIKSIIDWRL